MSDTIAAPWSDEQVIKLNDYQQCGWVHGYTCVNRGNPSHFGTGSEGLLEARNDGWHCDVCGYHQTWAHAGTFHGAPPYPFIK
jgi:hypothetical protein